MRGERGPQGDRGQHGDTGLTGAKGEPGAAAKERHLWPFLVVLVLVILVGVAALDAKSGRELKAAQQSDGWARYDTALAACRRGNLVRAQQQEITTALVATIEELAVFLKSSETFRRSQGEEALAKKSAVARARVLATLETLNPPVQVVCEDVVVFPPYPRPD